MAAVKTKPGKQKQGIVMISCSCKHRFQTSLYGNLRVHNLSGKHPGKARCTVCSSVKSV